MCLVVQVKYVLDLEPKQLMKSLFKIGNMLKSEEGRASL
ncbi:unnamed protein product [Brassica oleracea var. botrytis]|uniref:(rape) hypothetical protein n=1 Tax=Brassica napus TaxID=3708 RepID=A0A816K696_BRANA|nr:unnamed protein product [Brassica napus]